MKTLSYIGCIEENITINNIYYFGQLWNGDGDANQFLDCCTVSPDNINVVSFKIFKRNESPLDTLVKVIDIY